MDAANLRDFRSEQLVGLFPNWMRAVVVETNDPLNMGRVRFKCPEMHDHDLKPEKCPWALPAPSLGGPRSGSWVSPCIDDQIWINFEKDHPYGPLWTGAADPTRRKMYPLASVHTRTPLPVDEEGKPAEQPDDYDEEYLPKDGRPMSRGIIDRYGNLDYSSAIGFFPKEHDVAPPRPDYDAIQQSEFEQSQDKPEVNAPDMKMMVRITKYGHILLMGDQGYWWQKPSSVDQPEESGAEADGSDLGEFVGSPKEDDDWEVKRWRYLRRVLNEDEPNADQRRFMILTRYGHLIEARDVGWWKTRENEFGDRRTISKEQQKDQRWIKLRTKGGMLFQMSDMGFDVENDEWIKKLLVDEVGTKREKEDEYWKYKDARWIRWITRHGYKIVMDDRGSDTSKADENENPRGNGILIKGRRSPGSQGQSSTGDERGFYWEFNENDSTNQTTWGTPLGHTIQLNDKQQFCMIVAGRRSYARPFQRHKENEFLLEALTTDNIESRSHHCKLDHHNEYVRLKTRAGHGDPPHGKVVVRAKNGEQQGLECRDGVSGDGPWVELVDVSQRGLWFWDRGFVICRAKQMGGSSKIEWWFDESKMQMVLRNGQGGYILLDSDGNPILDENKNPQFIPAKIQLTCIGNIELIALSPNGKDGGNIILRADKEIIMSAGKRIAMEGQGALWELSHGQPRTPQVILTPNIGYYGPPVTMPTPPEPSEEPQLQPSDRGKRYNESLDSPAPLDEVEHRL